MRFPFVIHTPETLRRKANLARRRSPLVWPYSDLSMHGNVRLQARIALRETISDHFHQYRSSANPEIKAKFRSYLRAKIAAIRILAV